jgi:hypothetical protein
MAAAVGGQGARRPQLGDARPQVGGGDRPDEGGPHHAGRVGHHHRGHGVDAVALVDGTRLGDLELLDRHLVAGQQVGLVPHPGTRGTGGRREHRHQPRGVGAAEVVAVDPVGERVADPGRRGPRATPLQHHRHRDGGGDEGDDEQQAVHGPRIRVSRWRRPR